LPKGFDLLDQCLKLGGEQRVGKYRAAVVDPWRGRGRA
jgi:hypothetical protein